MAHPLESSYHWQGPVGISTVGLVVCIGILVRSDAPGWLPVALILVLLWLLFVAVVWVRTRAHMEVDGPVLRVRRVRQVSELDGRKVLSVKEFRTPNGMSYRVTMNDDPAPYVVPTALLRKGHSTFFEWVLTWSPGAELDTGSLRSIDQLRTRGLLE